MNYFESSAALNPFTHTWSLGVEEQFYLIFPLIINKRVLQFATMRSVFLWLSLHLFNQDAAFYTMPARIWEFGLGLALCRTKFIISKRIKLETFCFGLLLTAFCLPVNIQPLATLLSAISSVGLIYALQRDSSLKRLFSHPWITAFGKRAYGIYLWHWPLLVISRNYWPDNQWQNTFLPLAATFLFAYLSYQYIESPLRAGTWGFTQALPVIGLVATSLIILYRSNLQSTIEYSNFYKFNRR